MNDKHLWQDLDFQVVFIRSSDQEQWRIEGEARGLLEPFFSLNFNSKVAKLK